MNYKDEIAKRIDGEAAERIANSNSPEELAEALSKSNIELEEGIDIREVYNSLKSEDISEEALEYVAGGVIATGTALLATAAFTVGVAGIGFLVGYAKQTYKNFKDSKKKN